MARGALRSGVPTEALEIEGRRLVFLPSAIELLEPHWRRADPLAAGKRLAHLADRWDLARIETADGPLFAKRQSEVGLRRARSRLTGCRAERAFRNGHRLRERKVSTPEPVAWLDEGAGRAILFTRFVEGRALFEEPSDELFDGLARGIARLHLAGYRHRDLKAPNFLVTGDATRPRIWILDLDGAHKDSAPPSRRHRIRDWGRLAASFHAAHAGREELGLARLRACLTTYLRRLGEQRADDFARRVLQWADAKAVRNRRRGRPLA